MPGSRMVPDTFLFDKNGTLEHRRKAHFLGKALQQQFI